MKILYIQPGPGIGGAKLSLCNLLKGASGEHNSQVVLSTPADDQYLRMLGGYVEKVHELWMPTWRKRSILSFPNRAFSTFARFKRGWYFVPTMRIARIIQQESIDLVHTNNIVTPVGAFAAYLTGRPHVWHVREPVGSGSSYPLLPGDNLSAFLFHKLSKAIICNSDFSATFFRKIGVQPRVVPNGVDLASFKNAGLRGTRLRKRLGLDPNALTITMVGTIKARWKQHDLFLRTIDALKCRTPECQFIVFGGSSNLDATPYTRALKQASACLEISNRLVWADFVNDIPAIMYSLDILVHPASKEGSGRVVMEAMAAGKPVIGVKSGGAQELILDGTTGILVPPNDPQALAEAVRYLLENPDHRRSMGTQAQKYANEHFSNTKTTEAILSIYQEIISDKSC